MLSKIADVNDIWFCSTLAGLKHVNVQQAGKPRDLITRGSMHACIHTYIHLSVLLRCHSICVSSDTVYSGAIQSAIFHLHSNYMSSRITEDDY